MVRVDVEFDVFVYYDVYMSQGWGREGSKMRSTDIERYIPASAGRHSYIWEPVDLVKGPASLNGATAH